MKAEREALRLGIEKPIALPPQRDLPFECAVENQDTTRKCRLDERTLSVFGPDTMLGAEGGWSGMLALSLRIVRRLVQSGSVARHAGIGGHGDVRMERAVDPGHSEESATNRSSGLGYHSVVVAGPERGRSSPPPRAVR